MRQIAKELPCRRERYYVDENRRGGKDGLKSVVSALEFNVTLIVVVPMLVGLS